MNNTKIICALIGLMGAVNNNGKTENTDEIVRVSLISEDIDEIIKMIHEEKYTISPGCKDCTMPCGNTSDYDPDKLFADENTAEIKKKLIYKLSESSKDKVSDITYRALSYLGYGLEKEAYEKIIEELN